MERHDGETTELDHHGTDQDPPDYGCRLGTVYQPAVPREALIRNGALSRAYCYRYCYRSAQGVRNWLETSRFRRGRLIN
jgi:hypothetical protein